MAGMNNSKLFSLWIVPVLIIFGLLGYVLSPVERNVEMDLPVDKRRGFRRQYGMYALIGLLILCAGYIPYASIMPPNTDTLGSRTNMYAIPGASLLIVSVLNLIGLTLTGSEKRIRWLVLSCIFPLALVGLATGWEAQRQARLAWNEEGVLWNSLFKAAPDFKNGTTVYLVMPEFHQMRFLQRAALLDGWETENALQVLYNNPTINASIIFLDDQREPQFQRTIIGPEGIKFPGHSQFMPYSSAVFVFFDPKTNQLAVLTDVKRGMGLNFSPSDYHPDGDINPAPRPGIKQYRYLVTPGDSNPVPRFRMPDNP
jgi:hypothetical protein